MPMNRPRTSSLPLANRWLGLALTCFLSAMPAAFASDWVEDGASASSNSKIEKSGGAITLKLGVEHSESVAPVPLKLQLGEIFDERILSTPSRLQWYRIPEWMAGKWRRQQETIVSTRDFQTGQVSNARKAIRSEQIADFGVQRDSKGAIWNCNLSMKGVSDRGSYRSVALVRKQVPVVSEPGRVVLQEEFVVLHVMHGTGAIMESHIVESLTQYRPIKRGLLETSMSVKIYQADGSPKNQQENVAFDRLITPFTSVDKYKGLDVRADFENFLRSSNQANLIVDPD